jgi:zinc transport system permease protein
MSYLFGDLLAVDQSDLVLMYGTVVVILLVFSQILSPLISMSVNEELARVDGVAVEKIRFVFMILLALVIAIALKVVGILLITALLIIPAATARLFSKSPRQMVLMSVFMAIAAVVLGLYSSLNWDIPTGPSIVVSSSLLFFLSRIFSRA